MDGQIVGICTSTIDEKCQAFDTLVVYCATLRGQFAPYLTQSLELSLPALKFYFHDGVREATNSFLYFHLWKAERNIDITSNSMVSYSVSMTTPAYSPAPSNPNLTAPHCPPLANPAPLLPHPMDPTPRRAGASPHYSLNSLYAHLPSSNELSSAPDPTVLHCHPATFSSAI
ncbi:hypothetical protein DFJ58DRAFT_892845 [Suillus subalutaceus]|uniref:uncharacterized protein n=1 Tax=Suillus subalutaceus TaxID=48586 RepID=UPI001B86E034|nr:uncharacterized protein DFJ58DRAFT_892845 [Suillus subalutaceus]KAG1871381.1 hypothetical protein DFJ58DRAFT_892845 [Suillus subalutaceus]